MLSLAMGSAEYGAFQVTRTDDGSLTVDRADPRILISAELLDMMRDGTVEELAHPDLRLEGDVLTIDAANRRVIYRIGEYLMLPDCYVAEWPD